MDIRRVVLYGAFALVVYSLWMHWQIDYPPLPIKTASIASPSDTSLLPNMAMNGSSENTAVALKKEPMVNDVSQTVGVKTDVFNLAIDLHHGDIITAKLLEYPLSSEAKNEPFVLLQNETGARYVANSDLFVTENNKAESLDITYSSQQQQYELQPGQNQLVVTLEGKTAEGLLVTKTFVFTQGSYLIEVSYHVTNEGNSPWIGYLNTQLLRSSPEEDKSSMFHVGSYTGASYSEPGVHRYQKVNFKDMTKKNLSVDANGGWIAMQQHYFLSAWVPMADSKNRFYTRSLDGDYAIGSVSQPLTVAPNGTGDVSSRLYLGPEITGVLKGIAPSLDLTVDYGWLWFLSSLLFSFMKAIYTLVGNWGWSIVLVTLVIKLLFFRLSATSYKSMANMRKLQPKLQALRERYGDDKAKISQATMELYRQEKVNPLGGCLPIIIQIPVFIALYWVLLESVELRQAPFILWIHDLAAADPYHILPIIMGSTMLIQQKLNPAPPDPMQARIMMFLPILFTGLFWNFPSGLVLYWIVNNSLSILQQWYITRKYSGDAKPTKPTKNKRLAAK